MIPSKPECTIRNFNLYSMLNVLFYHIPGLLSFQLLIISVLDNLTFLIPDSSLLTSYLLLLTPSSYLVSINLKLTPKSDEDTG